MAKSHKYPKPVKWIPKNLNKYSGNVENIILRSSLEKRFALWCDRNDAITSWLSEEIIIPYISPIDNKPHRYFIDFKITTQQTDGSKKVFWVEIKPLVQTSVPKKPTRLSEKSSRTYATAIETFAINQAKWVAATKIARQNNAEFIVITEKDLGIG
jgi:hypothetical protein